MHACMRAWAHACAHACLCANFNLPQTRPLVLLVTELGFCDFFNFELFHRQEFFSTDRQDTPLLRACPEGLP